MEEKRKYVRVKAADVRVVYKIMGVKGEYAVPALDISGGGLRLPLKNKVKSGTLLELNIFLPPGNDPFFGFAKVAWQNPAAKKNEAGIDFYETGVVFIRVGFENRKRIINYINTTLSH